MSVDVNTHLQQVTEQLQAMALKIDTMQKGVTLTSESPKTAETTTSPTSIFRYDMDNSVERAKFKHDIVPMEASLRRCEDCSELTKLIFHWISTDQIPEDLGHMVLAHGIKFGREAAARILGRRRKLPERPLKLYLGHRSVVGVNGRNNGKEGGLSDED